MEALQIQKHEHAWEHQWDNIYKCEGCEIFGFSKHFLKAFISRRGFKNPRVYKFICSTNKCRRPARAKMPGRNLRGAYIWGCTEHSDGAEML